MGEFAVDDCAAVEHVPATVPKSNNQKIEKTAIPFFVQLIRFEIISNIESSYLLLLLTYLSIHRNCCAAGAEVAAVAAWIGCYCCCENCVHRRFHFRQQIRYILTLQIYLHIVVVISSRINILFSNHINCKYL